MIDNIKDLQQQIIKEPDGYGIEIKKITGKYTIPGYRIERTFNLTIQASPTGNCQLSSLKTLSVLLNFNKETFLKILKFVSLTNRNILLIDAKECDYQKFTKNIGIPDEYFLFKRRYRSTNGSRMRIMGLNLVMIRNSKEL